MAQVLTVPREPDGRSYYASSPLKRSSTSYSSFYASPNTYQSTTPSCPRPSSASVLPLPYTSQLDHRPQPPTNSPVLRPCLGRRSCSDLSYSPPSLHNTSSSHSFRSSLSSDCSDNSDDGLSFPSYDGGVEFIQSDEPLGLLSPNLDDTDTDSSLLSNTTECPMDLEEPLSATTDSSISESPIWTPNVVDDTAVRHRPSRHVDYLSHDWCEEDIWSSWRHIVSRRSVYGQRSRLENASWRTWGKAKYDLPTVEPETLNWLKDSDVTWLYGPLQPATSHPVSCRSPVELHTNAHSSASTSSSAKKPILKKRSMSEVMLQRSLSNSCLVSRAAASVQAQQAGVSAASIFGRTPPELPTSTLTSNTISRDQLDYFSPRTMSSSSTETPSEDGSLSRRHIRFDDKVEQCIAVECKDPDCDSDDESEPSSESEGEVVMIRTRGRSRRSKTRRSDAEAATPTGKSIEKLPDTTLKCRDSPDLRTTEQTTSFFGQSWSSRLFQSPSQETIRPENPNKNFLLSSNEEAVDDTEDVEYGSSSFSHRRDSVALNKSRLQCSWNDDADEEHEAQGLRRTASGMFMPYEEDEDDLVAEQLGLLGKVSDTINTARDIAHVIWNVGWRK